MEYKPKQPPEDINVTRVHPLVDLAHLLVTVVIASTIIYFTKLTGVFHPTLKKTWDEKRLGYFSIRHCFP